jgi:hypothetical protein
MDPMGRPNLCSTPAPVAKPSQAAPDDATPNLMSLQLLLSQVVAKQKTLQAEWDKTAAETVAADAVIHERRRQIEEAKAEAAEFASLAITLTEGIDINSDVVESVAMFYYSCRHRGRSAGTAFTNFTIFLIKNPANFLLAPLSGILPLACPLT